MTKKILPLTDLIYILQLGLAEARLCLRSARIPIPDDLNKACDQDVLKELKTLFAREKIEGKKQYAKGYTDGCRATLERLHPRKKPAPTETVEEK